jgi:hypothetical protein
MANAIRRLFLHALLAADKRESDLKLFSEYFDFPLSSSFLPFGTLSINYNLNLRCTIGITRGHAATE